MFQINQGNATEKQSFVAPNHLDIPNHLQYTANHLDNIPSSPTQVPKLVLSTEKMVKKSYTHI